MSKEMKIRLANKRRAQKSRERKNKYTKDLEDKVALLQKQVKLLTLQVDKYKSHIAKHNLSIDEVFKSTHNQSIIEMMVEQLNSKSNISTISTRNSAILLQEEFLSENRMRVIDQAFEIIADHLIPDAYQMSFYFSQENEDSDYYANFQKLRKMKKYSKYQIQEAYDKKEINDCDLFFHNMDITDRQIEAINKYHHLVMKGKQNCREILCKLSEIRDKIRENGKLMTDYPSFVIPYFKHQQLVSRDYLTFTIAILNFSIRVSFSNTMSNLVSGFCLRSSIQAEIGE
jgi:hypothetical protein